MADRELTITKADGTAFANSTVSTVRLALVSDSLLPSGKRALNRSFRAANASDPGRIRRAEFEFWGPIGASLESSAGMLGVDFCRNLETRWERRLTSAGKMTDVDLTGFDPPGGASYFGTAYFGTSYFSGGGALGGEDVIVFAEQNDYLLVVRGALLTQVDMSTDPWTVVSTTVLDAVGRDADHWRANAYIALGATAPMQRVVGANPSGVTLEDVTSTSPAASVYASAIKRGSDRAWFIDADQTGSSFNYANYTFDRFVTLASPFQVGDPDVGTTGIGPFGPFTQFGSEDGIYSFTDQGKPVPLSRALTAIHSDLNGYQFADPGWAWNYYTAITGLRANAGGADNPVGIGERMRGFTGHDGLPHAIWQARGELPLVYHTSTDTDYGYRGTFGPETGGTGQPLLWPWFYDSDGHCHSVFTSTTSVPTQGLWLIRANGTNLSYGVVAANGRDDLYPSYEYATAGGVAYLTTLDRDPNLLKVLRLARFRTRNMDDDDADSWTVAFAFDPDPDDTVGATYVSLDTVTGDGRHTIAPDNGTPTGQGNPSPTTGISGFSFKPRITQVAAGVGSATTPPELVGTLEVEYDERPELVQDVEVVVNITGTGHDDNFIWDFFRQVMGEQTSAPLRFQLPDDFPPAGGGQAYGMVNNVVNRTDIKGDDIQAVSVFLTFWPQSEALG